MSGGAKDRPPNWQPVSRLVPERSASRKKFRRDIFPRCGADMLVFTKHSIPGYLARKIKNPVMAAPVRAPLANNPRISTDLTPCENCDKPSMESTNKTMNIAFDRFFTSYSQGYFGWK